MRICFFQALPNEVEFFSKRLAEQECSFFSTPLDPENINVFRDAEILCVRFLSKITAKTIAAMPHLKAIVTRTTGYDHIDLAACKEQGIRVGYIPRYGDITVAEHTISLMLALARRSKVLYGATEYKTQQYSDFFELFGKTLGVIGAGAIGQHVIRIANGFGMRCVVYDVYQNPELAQTLSFSYVSLDALLACADVVTLHTPHLPATHHLMNRERFSHMKKGSVLINTARGGLVDTFALYEALSCGHVAQAGLDVIEYEEQIASGKLSEEHFYVKNLLQMPQVIFTPHVGCYSVEAQRRILEMTVQNIESFMFDRSMKWQL